MKHSSSHPERDAERYGTKTARWAKDVLRFIRGHAMFPAGARVLCALSGGADSVALLFFLRENAGGLGLSSVAAAHFNHRLRGADADADEAFARSLCQKHGIPFHAGRADVAAEARRRGAGVEETARTLRYDFLEKMAARNGFSHIATGHTADDNAETVLLHLARGAGLAGLCGIPPMRGNVVRPFLSTSRADIERFLSERGLPHIEDASNTDTAFARNRVRLHAVPALLGINPRFAAAVSDMTALLRQDEDCLLSQARGLLSQARPTPEGVVIPAEAVSAAHPAIGSRLCRLLYMQASGGYTPPDTVHAEAMLALCAGTDPAGRVSLPGGLAARRVYGDLVIGPPPEPVTFAPRPLDTEGDTAVPEAGLLFSCRAAVPGDFPGNNTRLLVAEDAVRGTLRLRPRASGDRMNLPGAPGGKSLKKLMIDRRLPRQLREALPVLCDDRGIVALAGFGTDTAHTARPDGKALCITVSRIPRADGPPLWDGMDWWEL